MPTNLRLAAIKQVMIDKPQRYGPVPHAPRPAEWKTDEAVAALMNEGQGAANIDVAEVDAAAVRSLIKQPEWAAVNAILVGGPLLFDWLKWITAGSGAIKNTVHVREGFQLCFPGANNVTLARLQTLLKRATSDADGLPGGAPVAVHEVQQARDL